MYTRNKQFVVSEMKTSELLISNPYLILVFEHLGISMEVREKTVSEICAENNLSSELFLIIVNLFNGFNPEPIEDYSFRDIEMIIRFLKSCHRYYLEEKYPAIKDHISLINKINDHHEISMIGKFFDKYFREVTEHLDYEDEVVFPYVLALNNRLNGEEVSTISSYSVNEYREHHDDIEEKLADLNNLLIKYIPLKNDQKARRNLLLSLFELEYDLKVHSQIEETILIPMVEIMEKLAGKSK